MEVGRLQGAEQARQPGPEAGPFLIPATPVHPAPDGGEKGKASAR